MSKYLVNIFREKLDLFAVICIETSHYVSFVRCGNSLDSPWVFFDSMADREGAQNGYNIPEVRSCDFLPALLSDKRRIEELGQVKDNRMLEAFERRLLCDAYICLYKSPELEMYR